MTTPDLVDQFEAYSLEQDQAWLYDEQRKINRIFDVLRTISDELKSRPGDERRALAQLYDHPNMQVRLNAVKSSLAVEPVEGRRQLQLIAESGDYPAAGEAGMSIRNLEEGIFVPK
ncbi:DUF2019 domain-containing protein [Terrihabitans rhizophilus]|uniref:DUF2019 domain-containing protein n=1 Tax=Terrihabitans rhizophilus TaxID=3092662 RepID=A0ABU4RKM0_9HYPH|nr:DUF2019 domain-containing protein [Terrihabitans sp. PJ23]MDX6804609.1 DUF2019 domain-containing protein [Terrihabitans sp. PJ23]